ncbi:uncharacterized protein LOC122073161 [Macadamia integrifolia]|uniref:uncharacterized protein LOC122073161 n=1 Tax=Macadamia integrifolia TaxID=60698 RepID=UPI001C4E6522|nr:uncharacterized protein LOC122073161 [Macadamia integrifolia]
MWVRHSNFLDVVRVEWDWQVPATGGRGQFKVAEANFDMDGSTANKAALQNAWDRILACRLGKLLPKLISEEQGAFVKRRNILDNAALVNELAQDIDRKSEKVILFSNLIWRRLMTALWVISSQLEMSNKETLYPQVFFILAEEVLSRGLRSLFFGGHAKYFHVPRGCPSISYSLYADDTIIFAQALKSSMMQIIGFISRYEVSSGQLVNKSKSYFLMSSKTPERRIKMVEEATGFKRGSFPVTYLGIPIIKGRARICHFNAVLEKVSNKLAGWKGKLLSTGDKIILIKHVLCNIPIYLLSASLHKNLEKTFCP